MNDLDVVDIDADFFSHDLSECRFFALSVRIRADKDVHLTGRMESHDGALP